MSEGTSFNNYLIERLRDPLIAWNYITEAIEEHDPEYLKVALRDVVKAYGVGEISEKSGLNRQTIYKMLSEDGDPTHKKIVAILNAIGLELTVKPKKTAAS